MPTPVCGNLAVGASRIVWRTCGDRVKISWRSSPAPGNTWTKVGPPHAVHPGELRRSPTSPAQSNSTRVADGFAISATPNRVLKRMPGGRSLPVDVDLGSVDAAVGQA